MKYGMNALIFCGMSITFSSRINSKPFAQQWVHTYAITPDGRAYLEDHELNLLVNFFYISSQRSFSIITLQKNALQALNSVWKEWYYVTQLRRDPTRTHSVESQLMSTQVQTFTEQLGETQRLCTDFTKLLHYLMSEDTLSEDAQLALHSIQQEEHVLIAKVIAGLNHDIQNFITDTLELEPEAHQTTKGSSILDFVWSCLPPLAIDSFVNTDQTTMNMSQENWAILSSLQELTNRNWSLIEQVRASFYYELYKTTYEAVHQHVNAEQFFSSFFKQNQSMPAP